VRFCRGFLRGVGLFQKQIGHPVNQMLSKRNSRQYGVKLRLPDEFKILFLTAVKPLVDHVDLQ
jgi:hypothetical protein